MMLLYPQDHLSMKGKTMKVMRWWSETRKITFIRDARRQLVVSDIKGRLGNLVKSYVVS